MLSKPQQRRIVRPVNNASAVRLQGTLAPRARADLDRGPVASRHATGPHDDGLFAHALHSRPSSTGYSPNSTTPLLPITTAGSRPRNSETASDWLTPMCNWWAAWLTSQGFTVDEIARSRTWIAFSGTAAQVETAFHAPLHNYMVGGKLHFAPSVEAAVPDAFAPVVSAITGLNDFRPRPHSKVRHVDPRLTSSLSGNHFVVPGDFGTIYNLPRLRERCVSVGQRRNGTDHRHRGADDLHRHQSRSHQSRHDNATFRSLAGLPAGSLTLTPVGSPNNFAQRRCRRSQPRHSVVGRDRPERATSFLRTPKNALNTSLPSLVNQNVATVISISYGDCEANFSSGEYTTIEGALSQANAQGQTVTVAAGDVGAADCDGTPQNPVATATHGLAVDYPSSSVYVTAMGGTQFTGDSTATPVNGVAPAQTYWNSSSDPNDTSPSAFSYIPEVVWNEGFLGDKRRHGRRREHEVHQALMAGRDRCARGRPARHS